ncbi:MAG: PH domain-containing protein [Planctomycetes bacterium]|nr:PH domain-containing protein [Planctomycetota bacterium]
MKCRFCQSEVPDEGRFCPTCGAALRQSGRAAGSTDTKTLPAPPGEKPGEAPLLYSPAATPASPGAHLLDHPEKADPDGPELEIIRFAPTFAAKVDSYFWYGFLLILALACYFGLKPEAAAEASVTRWAFVLSLLVVAAYTTVIALKEWLTSRLSEARHPFRLYGSGGLTLFLLALALYFWFKNKELIQKEIESLAPKSQGMIATFTSLFTGDNRHVLALAGAFACLYFLGWVTFRLVFDHYYFRYRITTHYVEIQKGILDFHDDPIHMLDVRDIRVHQSVGDKMFDTGRIVLFTGDPASVRDSEERRSAFVPVTLQGVPHIRKVYHCLKNINTKYMSKARRIMPGP